MEAPLTPLCTAALAERLDSPARLGAEVLLRSYRADEWPRWFEAAGIACPAVRGPVFDSSVLMIQAAVRGHGVALAPPALFEKELRTEALVRPFATEIAIGGYWLTRLVSRPDSSAMRLFRDWLKRTAGNASA
jgi:LysR family transcriptional regulator of beta-lactamase